MIGRWLGAATPISASTRLSGASRAAGSPPTDRSPRSPGLGGHARQVGYALHALDAGDALPWHRVLNAQGA